MRQIIDNGTSFPLTRLLLSHGAREERGGRHRVLPLGIIGNTTRDGCSRSRNTVFLATMAWVWRPIGSPVFGFTSKRGKLLLEMSSRMRWPLWNRLLVGGS